MTGTVLGSYTVWDCPRGHRRTADGGLDADIRWYCQAATIDPVTDRYSVCGERLTRVQAVEITL